MTEPCPESLPAGENPTDNTQLYVTYSRRSEPRPAAVSGSGVAPQAGGGGTTTRAYMPPAQRTNWATPPALFDALDFAFGPFTLDPCGDPESHASLRCRTFWAEGGLERPWDGRIFLNPPYGSALRNWVAKCWAEAASPRVEIIVALLPARTDTRWWHQYIGAHCELASEVRFLKGRLRFVGAPASAPFPSVIVVWRRGP